MRLKVNLEKYTIEESKMGIRINKYISDIGILSRREVDKLIESKKIHINDRVAILGEKVKNGDSIFLNTKFEKLKYFLYNKKKGEETAFKIINKIRYDSIGRLDKESEGLLLYSNDYRIVEELLNPENKFEREYIVIVRENATPRVKTILERGIYTKEANYSPAKVVNLDEENRHLINIILTEGKKHEIRRMLNALNLTIKSLRRVRFVFLTLGKMKSGETRELKKDEIEKLLKILNIKN